MLHTEGAVSASLRDSKQLTTDTVRQQLNEAEVNPVGYIFDLGVVIAFIVGAVIVYQILYSDVTDHLPEYATLKAMGFHDRYLLIVAFQESLILAALGFVPGTAIALGIYRITNLATMLPIFTQPAHVPGFLKLHQIQTEPSKLLGDRQIDLVTPKSLNHRIRDRILAEAEVYYVSEG